jgi:hypothetical protein
MEITVYDIGSKCSTRLQRTKAAQVVHKSSLISSNIFLMVQQPLVGQGLLIFQASRSHSDTAQSVGLIWTSDQPDAETSTWQNTTHNRQTYMPPAGFEPTIPAGERSQTHILDRAATGIGTE